MLMTESATEEIISDLLGGSAATQLASRIEKLPYHEYRKLCCTLCCMRNEVAANCTERADEIDRLLAKSIVGRNPTKCKIWALSSVWCPLVDHAPLDL
jgi:hypothetical protein